MKVWESEHVFDHPWATVCQAAWRKYPNPINPVVSGIDILERKVDGDGIMRTTRLLQTQWRIPSWATSLIGLQNPSLALEYSEVDPVAKTMTLRSRNLTCSCFVTIDESLVYRPHPDNANRTLLEQSAIIRVCGVPLIDRMESIVVSSVNSNASRGRQAMDWVINCIKQEYDELSNKISAEYQEISQKISDEYIKDMATSAKRGIAELRKFGMEEMNFSVNAGTEANLGAGSSSS